MNLSKQNLKLIDTIASKPGDALFSLPEKVIQFGTGVLLRGLPDYYIDIANRQKIFNGRIIVIKSTDTSEADFAAQDNLYTIHIKGVNNSTNPPPVICAAISRVLHAKTEWAQVLKCAHQKDLKIVISNTTEVGIQLIKEKTDAQPPLSFPAKLLAFLFERYNAFNGTAESGMIILPTELITDNAKKLSAILTQLAEWNNLEQNFINWLQTANNFCNTLVDRIVPGKPQKEESLQLQTELGYTDELAIIAEEYNLWAIEGDAKLKNILSFAQVNKGVIIEENIEKYKELKLRLLNASHTLGCGAAILSGFETVKQAMDNKRFFHFIKKLMLEEIAVSIPLQINKDEIKSFALAVLQRFQNPHIKHIWLNISQQYTAKIKMRVLPLLFKYYRLHNHAPQHIALGFAAYIVFMKPGKKTGNNYYGFFTNREYAITDQHADFFYALWKNSDGTETAVKNILQNKTLWDDDLTALPGFKQAVLKNVNKILSENILNLL